MLDIATDLRSSLRQALRIALPYFRSDERWSACALLGCIVAGQLTLVAMAVAENYWRNAFFQTLQEKNWPGFITQFLVYVAIGIGFVLATVYQRYFTQWLTIRWRRWLTTHYLDRWLHGSVHYRAMIGPGSIDNPDQRIAEDVRQFIEITLSLTVGLLGAIARLLSFVAILWALSKVVPLQLFGESYFIPGYLVWAALLYAVLGSVVTHWIGRSLIALDFTQEKREADFRFALVRVRENSESVALLRGEPSEKLHLQSHFRSIMDNWFRLMARQQWVGLFTGAYRRFSLYFPYFAMAPLYFGGNMQLGAFMQSGSAFNEVRDSFSYFISSYLKIAELSAVTQRLAQFATAMDLPVAPDFAEPRQDASDAVIQTRDLRVTTPDGKTITMVEDLALPAGSTVLITGNSGAGKTSFVRGIAAIWPYLTGDLTITAERIMALPQRAYIPVGTLRRAVSYPEDARHHTDVALQEVLRNVGLSALSGQLDEEAPWDLRLSEGEKQRLAVARALLFKPDLLLLDEATASLDEASEIALHRQIRAELPLATIVAVTHRDALARHYDHVIEMKASAD